MKVKRKAIETRVPFRGLARVAALTASRFNDLDLLFNQKGCSFARGCWCMAYREQKTPKLAGLELRRQRETALRRLTRRRLPPGLIGYDGKGLPIGWVAVGPRAAFSKLQKSRVMAPVDDQDVWSVVCFVVPSPHRGQGIAQELLKRSAEFAASHNAQFLEGYPIDRPGPSQDQWLWHGTMSMFEKAGFKEVARRKPTRPVMRLKLN